METKDKIAQIGHSAPGIDSLKIPAYQWWSEALHGVAGSPGVHFGGDVIWNILCQQLSSYTYNYYEYMSHALLYRLPVPPPSHKLLDLVQPSTCMCTTTYCLRLGISKIQLLNTYHACSQHIQVSDSCDGAGHFNRGTSDAQYWTSWTHLLRSKHQYLS